MSVKAFKRPGVSVEVNIEYSRFRAGYFEGRNPKTKIVSRWFRSSKLSWGHFI